MRWTVEGADKETGQDRVITVEADTKDQAEKIATGKGLLVSDIHKPVSLTEAEKAVEQLDALDALAAESMIASGSPSSPVKYVGPVPGYEDLQSGATVLSLFGLLAKVIGGLSIVVGALLLVVGIAGRMNVPANALPAPETDIQIASGASAVASGIVGVCSGAIMSMLGSAALALRDIARNSFR